MKRNNLVKSNKVLILLFVFVTALIISCTTDRPYTQPTSANHPTEAVPEEISTQKSLEATKEFKIEESATDGRLKVTVNSINSQDKITFTNRVDYGGENYDTSFDMNPAVGNKFLIVDITVENLQRDQTSLTTSIFTYKIIDEEGYSYDYNLNTAYLDRKWEDGDILPGMKKRGRIAFE